MNTPLSDQCYKSGAIRTEYNDPDSWKHDDELCSLKDDVEAALAAPARNCDSFWGQLPFARSRGGAK